jgi:hypothetical protein
MGQLNLLVTLPAPLRTSVAIQNFELGLDPRLCFISCLPRVGSTAVNALLYLSPISTTVTFVPVNRKFLFRVKYEGTVRAINRKLVDSTGKV